MTTTQPGLAPPDADEAPSGGLDDQAFVALVERLSHQSVTKHYDAYADIPWDDPAYAIDPDDPRWELGDDHPLGATAWYRAQPPRRRAEIGIFCTATAMKRGLEFENVLKRGLLDHAFYRIGNGDPRFRYLYHEVAEETHHGMMFQEFVNRSGADPAPMGRLLRLGTSRVVLLGHRFPAQFFLFVLGGEEPVDHVQRVTLRSGRALPPLVERIMRNHVTEEARHVSFARHYLKLEVPRLPRPARGVLSVSTPILLAVMSGLMLAPLAELSDRFGVPRAVLREARTSDVARRQTVDCLRKVRRLAREIGIVNPVSTLLWRGLRLWADD